MRVDMEQLELASTTPDEKVLLIDDALERLQTVDDDTAALVAWTDAVALATGPIADEVHAALARRYAEHQIVELLVTLGTTMLLNRLCTALSLPTSPETMARLAAEGFRP